MIPRFPSFKIDSYLWMSNRELDEIEGEDIEELADGHEEKSDSGEISPSSKL